MAKRQPEQQAPPVQWLRLRYAKRGPARFTSHRDFGRAFERALRRGDIPMAYSSGFSPHPRISYANASPTSAATEAEYLEIGLSETCDPTKVKEALNQALPPGMEIIEVAQGRSGSLSDLLTASAWLIDLGEVEVEVVKRAVATLLAAPVWMVKRMTKTGMREFDVRAAVLALEVTESGSLRLVSVQGTPLVRPDDVVSALRAADQELPADRPALLSRLIQGQPTEADPAALLDPIRGVAVRPW